MGIKVAMGLHAIGGLNITYKWDLGSCNGEHDYKPDKIFINRCCLPHGPHILTCQNEMNTLGWGISYIEIQGQRYCDDFIGIQAMREVLVKGGC